MADFPDAICVKRGKYCFNDALYYIIKLATLPYLQHNLNIIKSKTSLWFDIKYRIAEVCTVVVLLTSVKKHSLSQLGRENRDPSVYIRTNICNQFRRAKFIKIKQLMITW